MKKNVKYMTIILIVSMVLNIQSKIINIQNINNTSKNIVATKAIICTSIDPDSEK